MEYQNLDLEAFDYRKADNGTETFRVRVLRSPAGDQLQGGASQVVLPTDLRQRSRLLERRKLSLSELIELGETLGQLLFPAPARWFLDQSRAWLGEAGLRIRLQLDTYALADLPWEFSYIQAPDTAANQKSADGFLVLDRRISLVRYEVLGQPLVPLTPVGNGPLRMVALLAQPGDPEYQQQPLDLEAERRNIEQAMAAVSSIKPEFYPDATADLLMDALDRGVHIFHFAGHAEFKGEGPSVLAGQSGKGYLVLLDEDRRASLLSADKLALTLRGRGVRLAMLGGCETAERDRINAWTGIAPALTRAGIPAVIGMQYRVADRSAITFSKRFYRALAAGDSIDAAVTAGRLAVFTAGDDDERDWGVPVLYLRTDQGVLFPVQDSTAPAADTSTARLNDRSGVVIRGGTVFGPVVGSNSGAIQTSYGPSHTAPSVPPSARQDIDKVALREALVEKFSESDIESLCFEVAEALKRDGIQAQVNLETVGGTTKQSKVLNLIQFLDRRGYLSYLAAAAHQARPNLDLS